MSSLIMSFKSNYDTRLNGACSDWARALHALSLVERSHDVARHVSNFVNNSRTFSDTASHHKAQLHCQRSFIGFNALSLNELLRSHTHISA